jgi:hypothetical protein
MRWRLMPSSFSGRHAALHLAVLLHAAAEGQSDEVAIELVVPLVVGADELLDRARALAAEGHAAVGAAVLDHVQFAALVAHQDHAALADHRALEVAGVRHLALQPHVAPVALVEEALELAPVHGLVGVGPAGHAAGRGIAPVDGGHGWRLSAARFGRRARAACWPAGSLRASRRAPSLQRGSRCAKAPRPDSARPTKSPPGQGGLQGCWRAGEAPAAWGLNQPFSSSARCPRWPTGRRRRAA